MTRMRVVREGEDVGACSGVGAVRHMCLGAPYSAAAGAVLLHPPKLVSNLALVVLCVCLVCFCAGHPKYPAVPCKHPAVCHTVGVLLAVKVCFVRPAITSVCTHSLDHPRLDS